MTAGAIYCGKKIVDPILLVDYAYLIPRDSKNVLRSSKDVEMAMRSSVGLL